MDVLSYIGTKLKRKRNNLIIRSDVIMELKRAQKQHSGLIKNFFICTRMLERTFIMKIY